MKDQHKICLLVGIIAVFVCVRRKKIQKKLMNSSSKKKRRSIKADGKRRVLLIATGSVASVKVPDIVQKLVQKEIFVDLVFTEASYKFLTQVEYKGFKGMELLKSISILKSTDGVQFLQMFTNDEEWDSYNKVGEDSVLHIDLVKRNNVLLVSPLSANSLSKYVHGMADDLCSCIVRAFHYNMNETFNKSISDKYGSHVMNKPFIVAPAMNTYMYYQNITSQHLDTLKKRSVIIIPPISKTLACGDSGVGAMAEVTTIVDAVIEQLDCFEKACLVAKEMGLPQFIP